MQTVSSEDNLHEVSDPIFQEKNNITNLSSVESASSVVRVNDDAKVYMYIYDNARFQNASFTAPAR